jgi:hypothetical protein
MRIGMGAIVTGFTDVPTDTSPGAPCLSGPGLLGPGQSYCDGYGPDSCAGQGLVWDTVSLQCDSGSVAASVDMTATTSTDSTTSTILLVAAAAVAGFFLLKGGGGL